MKAKSIIASLLFLVTIAPAAIAADGAAACSATEKPADLDFTLQDMHGQDVRLDDYAGKVILLDFWATWCPPCRIEIPGFIELLDRYEARGLAVLGISVDDPADALQLYAGEMGMDYPVLVGAERDDVKEAYGPLLGFPTTFLIDRSGNICHHHTGFVPKARFEEEILQLL